MPQDFTLQRRRVTAGAPQPDPAPAPDDTTTATDTAVRLRALTPGSMTPAMRRALREQLPTPGMIARERQGAQTMRALAHGFVAVTCGFAGLAARATYRAANAAPEEQLKQSALGMGALAAGSFALGIALKLEDNANPRLDAIDTVEALRPLVGTDAAATAAETAPASAPVAAAQDAHGSTTSTT